MTYTCKRIYPIIIIKLQDIEKTFTINDTLTILYL